MKTIKAELLPCPFCGGHARMTSDKVDGLSTLQVVCEECGISTPVYVYGRYPKAYRELYPKVVGTYRECTSKAFMLWNRRNDFNSYSDNTAYAFPCAVDIESLVRGTCIKN